MKCLIHSEVWFYWEINTLLSDSDEWNNWILHMIFPELSIVFACLHRHSNGNEKKNRANKYSQIGYKLRHTNFFVQFHVTYMTFLCGLFDCWVNQVELWPKLSAVRMANITNFHIILCESPQENMLAIFWVTTSTAVCSINNTADSRQNMWLVKYHICDKRYCYYHRTHTSKQKRSLKLY